MPGCLPRERQRHGSLQVCSRSLRVTSGASPSQPPVPKPLLASLRNKTRSPKSEFQFSSATRRVHISPPPRPRGAQARVRGRRQHMSGEGGVLPAPSSTYAGKEKVKRKTWAIKAKTQGHLLLSTNNPRQEFARSHQPPNRNYNQNKSPFRVTLKVLDDGVQRGPRLLRTHTGCAKIHRAQPGTSCTHV